jgi:hypothetical protein
MTSYGSTTAASEAGLPPKFMDFNTIDAEIDTIKVDVQKMRAEAESQQRVEELSTPKQLRNLSVRVAGSKIPTPALSHVTVARAIELSKTGMANPCSGEDLPLSSPAIRSYAGVGTGKTRASAAAPMISPTSEASSYATCATSSYHDAVEHLQAFQESDRGSPHFAQPTQAASRGVDETLRKETSPAKPSPETTPGKSIKAKAPELETNKRAAQRGQKRTSLPDGWMSSPDQTGSAERGLHKKEQIHPGSGKTPTSAEQSSPGPSLRKKTSSYMSPTKSAQNRSIATIGEDKQTRKSLRMKAGALRVNTTLANKDARSGNASDDSSVSPKTQSSFATSKKELSSPLKTVASAKTSDGPSVVIKLPLPLPHVANTTVSPRNPDGNFLDPIGEKLGKEDLLRRDSTQESASTRTDRISILTPVLARLNRNTTGDDNSTADPMRLAGEAIRALIQPKPRDPDNEPISQLISGLRGQRSAEIGRALAGGQHSTSSAQFIDSADTEAPIDPAVVRQSRESSGDPVNLYQGRKQSVSHEMPQDSSIMFQGRKLSISHDMPQDPAIAFNSGPLNPGVPADTTDQRKTSQARSLRATATYFVPPSASDPAIETDPSIHGAEGPGAMWWPKGLDLFHKDDHVDRSTGSLSKMGFMPRSSQRSLLGTWHCYKFVPLQDESMLDSAFEPQSTLLRPVDLIHGDTPDDSPTLDDASSTWLDKQDERNQARWEIMGKGRHRYHWTGGDGLEISFKGMGLDAEHDPNSPVLYRNYRENTDTLHMEAESYPRTQVPGCGSPLPPNAPKLMRNYAEKMALARIPCSNDQWTGNYDLKSNIVPVPGLCDPCKQGDTLLHRIGGGVDLFR